MTRDGLAEQNLATGEETLISSRRPDFDPRKAQAAPDSTISVRQAISEGRSHRQAPYTPDAVRNSRQTENDRPDETSSPPSEVVPESLPAGTGRTEMPQGPAVSVQPKSERNRKRPLSEQTGRLHFDDTHGEASGAKSDQHHTKYQRRFMEEAGASDGAATDSDGKAETAGMPKTDKLRFSESETPSGGTAPEKKLKKAQYKAEHSAVKLEAAKKRLPTKYSVKVEQSFDAESGKSKRRLQFEEEVKTQSEHLKGPLPTRPVKAGASAALGYAHKKIGQAEQENVGVEAAHKGERLLEGGLRRTYRFQKLQPYRRVAKLEQKSAKHAANFAWQKTLRENPKLQSNPLSRMAQKRKIKKQYAQAAREAKLAAERTKKAGTAAAKATKAGTSFVSRHPVLVGTIALILVVVFFFSTLFTSCSSMGGGSFTSTVLSSYTSEDEDIIAVEEKYTQLETALQARIDNIESEYPGFDEYRYSLAQIGHDPFALASYLTSLYFDYTPEEAEEELQRMFGQQYILTVTEVVEVRYRTEIHTDSEGNSYTVEVAYNYYILNVSLENRAINSVVAMNLDAPQMEMYGLYMETKGNKSYLFEGNIYIDRGDPTGGYTVPGEALSNPDFAALIAEAEKYLGYPYVWGGSSPSTSFDCSGFVCWVLNQSGVANVGRTTANGLYNMCSIVSASEAKPGDLIFFQGTYNTSGASHIGIYVGNNTMIHCGNPIQYTSINTTYWQSHFLAFGRIQ